MTSDRAALREKVARAIAATQDEEWENPALFLADANDTAESGREAYRDMADAAIAVVLEEAARVADDKTIGANTNDVFDAGWASACADIAAAIRGLKG
jgi:hypothetical protein